MPVIDESQILVHNGQPNSAFQQGPNSFFTVSFTNNANMWWYRTGLYPMPKHSSKILFQIPKTSTHADQEKTRNLLSLRSTTGENNTPIAFKLPSTKATAHLLTFSHLWEWLLIASVKHPRSKWDSQHKNWSTVTSLTTNAMEVMWLEFSTGERERDSFQRDATLTQELLASVKMITWKAMNAESTMRSTELLTTVLLKTIEESRRKSWRMAQS